MSINGVSNSGRTIDRELVIIGSGFSGIASLYYAREAGLDVALLEAGTGVGGTWHWNTYPGACTDTEFWSYCFSFARDELSEWRWATRFPVQTEVEGYLNFVTDRLDLRKYIKFSTRVRSLSYDESENLWTIKAEDGSELVARYVVTAIGGLSEPHLPAIPGLDSFRGEILRSARWPKAEIGFEGKRVALVGTASTGVQILPEIAPAAKDVYVFQRTPNFVLPKQNKEVDEMQRAAVAANLDEIWQKTLDHGFAFPLAQPHGASSDFSAEQREKILEEKWAEGGFGFSFSTFDDIDTSSEANEFAAEFIRRKIRETVLDPQTAELLTPRGYPYGAKRPPVGDGYYEAFNRANVHLVDVSKQPISEITPTTLRVGEDEFEVDVIIFATGFDALTGALSAIEIAGRGGQRLHEHWSQGVRTHTGLATEGFPNLFYVYGPQTPHANIPPVVQTTAKWIIEAIKHLQANDFDYFEATTDAMENWHEELHKAADATLLRGTAAESKAWFMGANIPGKRVDVLVYLGGANKYMAKVKDLETDGYPGFVQKTHTRELTAPSYAISQ